MVILLGIIVFSITVSNIFLILFFAIPFTKKLNKVSLLKHNTIIYSYLVALILQIVILSVMTLIFYIFFFDGPFISLMIGYGFGMLGIVVNFKKFGLNLNNFSDYFEKNKMYFWEELVDKYDNNIYGLLRFIVAMIEAPEHAIRVEEPGVLRNNQINITPILEHVLGTSEISSAEDLQMVIDALKELPPDMEFNSEDMAEIMEKIKTKSSKK